MGGARALPRGCASRFGASELVHGLLGPGVHLGSNGGVRLGIRPQLLVAIAAVILLAFVPLVLAVSSLTRAVFGADLEAHARAIARVIAITITDAEPRGAELDAALAGRLGEDVRGLCVYDGDGTAAARWGPEAAVLPERVDPRREQFIGPTSGAPSLVVVVPTAAGAVGVALRVASATERTAPLLRLLALYAGLLALVLVALAYALLTRIVVAPLEKLRRAAGRVAAEARAPASEVRGARGAPDFALGGGGRELVELSESLQHMTEKLRADEVELRGRIIEIESATEKLRGAQATLVRSERLASVGRLAAGLAHELGNPISAVLGFQELLLEGGLDPAEERDFLRRMHSETERVSRVLRDLLDFARPAAPGSEEDMDAQGSVREAVTHVIALLRPQKSLSGVELVASLADDLPVVAIRNERIEQVLLNLVLNAADAVPKPGGRVTLGAHRVDDGVRIEVEDNGGGVHPSVRGTLFEPFVTTKEVGRGTGLGLAVCRGLIEAAGGSISVDDGVAGARFVVDLPTQAPISPRPSAR